MLWSVYLANIGPPTQRARSASLLALGKTELHVALIHGSDTSPEMGLYPVVKASKETTSLLSGRTDRGAQALIWREICVCSDTGSLSDFMEWYLSPRGKGLKQKRQKVV